jgi:response regulator NasT
MTPKHLLVVDDDRLVLATLASELRHAGYRVTEASSGNEALKHARETKLDLALLDIRMPGLTGLEIARQFEVSYGIPFVFLSAYGDRETVEEAVRNGALGFMVKPLNVAQILPSIQAAIVRADELRQLKQTESRLSKALAGSRDISMAVGFLMNRDSVTQDEAFDALRKHARSEHRPLAELAGELLNHANSLNKTGRPAL